MGIKHNLEQWIAQLDYDDTCDISDRKVSELIRGYSALEAKCAALAADNAALKSFGGKLADMHNDLNGEGTGIQGRAEVACQQVALKAAMEEFDAIKTPATDAFLAELRAQGVEMVIAYHRERAEALHHVDRNAIRHSMAALDASDVAAQLRQGGAE